MSISTILLPHTMIGTLMIVAFAAVKFAYKGKSK